MNTVQMRVPQRAEALESIRLFDMGERGCFVLEDRDPIPVNDIGSEKKLTAVIRKLEPEGFYFVGGDEANYQEARRLATKHAPNVVVLGYRKASECRMARAVLVPDSAYQPVSGRRQAYARVKKVVADVGKWLKRSAAV